MKTRRDDLQPTLQRGRVCHVSGRGLWTSGTRHPALDPLGSVGFLLHPLGIRRVEVRVKAPSAIHGWNLWFWQAPPSSGVAIKAAFFVLMFLMVRVSGASTETPAAKVSQHHNKIISM